MTVERLREAINAQPFRPCSVASADGRLIRVRGPEFVLMPPQAQRTLVVSESGEDYQILDVLMIRSIDFISARPRRGRSNGARRRK